MSKVKAGMGITAAATLAIATPLIASWEGVRTIPYTDIAGVRTVCYGETNDIEEREYTHEECLALLREGVPDYYQFAMQQVDVDIPITMRAAITSFTYNVGPQAFKSSTMLKKINRGDLWGACDELDRWSYVGKMWVRGLNNRRKAERRLCIAELPADV